MSFVTQLLGRSGANLLGRHGPRLLKGAEARLLGSEVDIVGSQFVRDVPADVGRDVDTFLRANGVIMAVQVREGTSSTSQLELNRPSYAARQPFVLAGIAAVTGLALGVLAGRITKR
jgi:hypothetical protein